MVNYSKLNFKSGIEAHQQLESHKLFCNCPSLVNDDNSIDVRFKRRLFASAGETGEIDIAAQYETQKNKEYNYEACSTSSCLIEYDEQPPNNINQEAIDIALEICLLFNAKIVDEILVMRKIVLDGSNVSGFQRTALIGYDGYIDTSKGKVNIPTIYLEEEGAKKVQDEKDSTTYKLDRLGIPLIEVATDASLKDPEHVKEVASIIGMILRSTGKVKRGIGSIRQDVNLSIKGHPRIEIKGFQDLKSIPSVVNLEIERQIDEINSKNKLESHVRKGEPDKTTSFLRPMPGASRLYPETDIPPIELDPKRISSIKVSERIDEKTIKLEKEYKINEYLAKEIVKSKIPFESYTKKFKLEPKLIAQVLIEIPKEIKSRFNLDISKIKPKDYEFILENLQNNSISKSSIIDILKEIIKGNKVDITKYKILSDKDLEKEIKKIVEENENASFNTLMGLVMKKFQNKIDGKKAAETIKFFLG